MQSVLIYGSLPAARLHSVLNQIPIQTPNQIIIQGNRRLENELIIRSSGIEKIGTDDKSLSLAIKNLYKTGYFEDVNIFKDKNIIFINVNNYKLTM